MARPVQNAPVAWALDSDEEKKKKLLTHLVDGIDKSMANLQIWIRIVCKLDQREMLDVMRERCDELFASSEKYFPDR